MSDTTATVIIDSEAVPEARELIVNSDRSLRVGSAVVEGYKGVLVRASEVATDLATIIEQKKLYVRIKNKDHVYCEGWTTLGSMLGVCAREVDTVESPTVKGEFISIMQAVRTSDGAIIGQASASCGPDESDWAKRSRQARRSMAQTRATGKVMRLLFSWVMQLSGYAVTPAEEVIEEGPPRHENPEQIENPPLVMPRGERVVKDDLVALSKAWQHLRKSTGHEASNPQFAAWVAEITGIDPAKVFVVQQWSLKDFSRCRDAILSELPQEGQP